MFVRPRLRAWLALVAFVGSFLLPLAVNHIVWDDDLGDGRPLSGHAPVQFDAATGSAQADHCALCHWWRAIGHANAGPAADASVWLQPDERREPLTVASPDHLVVRDRPSRAPPASSL
jgi:hypothetical protein